MLTLGVHLGIEHKDWRPLFYEPFTISLSLIKVLLFVFQGLLLFTAIEEASCYINTAQLMRAHSL